MVAAPWTPRLRQTRLCWKRCCAISSQTLSSSRAQEAFLAARRRQGRVAFAVYDTGTGIAADQQERVFGEFERARQDVSGPNEGLGLGLSIVKRYAELLQIDIKLASRVGRGTAFTLSMPDFGYDVFPRANRPPIAGNDATSLSGLHVLLIDDDPLILSAMQRELTDRGCTINAFASGDGAETALSGRPATRCGNRRFQSGRRRDRHRRARAA